MPIIQNIGSNNFVINYIRVNFFGKSMISKL